MDKICIMSRVRPSNIFNDNTVFIDLEKSKIKIANEKKNILEENKIIKKEYKFDRIFDESYSNDDLFNDFGMEICHNLINNLNTTFYVYGQTGSGKSHTIIGNEKEPGILHLILNFLLSNKSKLYTINCVQIHNNKCYDILNNNNLIYEREDSTGKINLCNVNSLSLNLNYKNILESIKKNRFVGISGQNSVSSRSHLLFQINSGNNFIKILDLAGSEKAKNSIYVDKSTFKENAEINKSIMALKECIRAVKKNENYIPYRGSKLTKLLKDSFNKNSKTYVIATISPEKANVLDSINTLDYIQDLKSLDRIQKLKPVKEPTRRIYRNYSNLDKFRLSNGYKEIVNYRNNICDINKERQRIFDVINRNKSTRNHKERLLKNIDNEINLLNKVKNCLY